MNRLHITATTRIAVLTYSNAYRQMTMVDAGRVKRCNVPDVE